MKVVFVSNYFNHHQKPLCDALAAGADFAFLQTEAMPSERQALGWQSDKPVYVTEDLSALDDADVVIAGSAPEKLILPCIRRGTLVFRYRERPLKEGNGILKYIPRLMKWHWQNPGNSNIWLLCAGSEVASDYARFGLFQDRALKWGYFPESGTPTEKARGSIVWAGRLIDWKHPDAAIRLAEQLRAEGYDFRLEILGAGPMEQVLHQQIKAAQLQDYVHLAGAMPPEKVRQRMAQAEIFLFTSDRREGWGAVLNEAMSCGCAVVASKSAGATGYLVQHGQNGLCYGTEYELFQDTKTLLRDDTLVKTLGVAAQTTISQCWNGEVAAQRLLTIAAQILAGKQPQLWKEGPCSKPRGVEP